MSETQSPYLLTVMTPPMQGHQFPLPLDQEKITIGRGEDNDIVIDAPSISRRHAALHWDHGRFRIVDEGSRNGIQVDGRLTRDAFLVPGCTIGLGDVILRLDSAAPPVTRVATTEIPGTVPVMEDRSAGVEAIVARSVAEAHARGPARTARTVLILTGMAIGIMVLTFAVWIAAQGSSQPKVLELDPVMVKVNEQRLISTRKRVQVGGQWVTYRPDFTAESIRVEDPDIAEVRKFEYEPAEMVITGKSSGSTDATMRSLRGNIIRVRIIVRGRLDDPLEPYRHLPESLAVRRPLASQHIAAGDRLAKTDLSAALFHYRVARELMKPHSAFEPYGEAKRKVEATEATIEKRYGELRNAARQAVAIGDYARYDKYLEEILHLIADPNDPRHQRAQLERQGRIIQLQAQRRRRT